MKKKLVLTISILVVGSIFSACSAPKEPVLTVSGSVEADWTEYDLKSLPVMESEYTNKDGETTVYEGIAFTTLLEEAGVVDYKSITLSAADGYSVEVTSEELSSCTSCIVAFQDGGGLCSVMPDFSGKQQVRDLIEISVK